MPPFPRKRKAQVAKLSVYPKSKDKQKAARQANVIYPTDKQTIHGTKTTNGHLVPLVKVNVPVSLTDPFSKYTYHTIPHGTAETRPKYRDSATLQESFEQGHLSTSSLATKDIQRPTATTKKGFHSLESLPYLVLDLAHDLWHTPSETDIAQKPWVRAALSFQQSIPQACVTKNMLMGVLGNSDATGLERTLNKLENELVYESSISKNETEKTGKCKGPVLWTILVDALDVKQVVVLSTAYFRKLDVLCQERSKYDVTPVDTEEAVDEFLNETRTARHCVETKPDSEPDDIEARVYEAISHFNEPLENSLDSVEKIVEPVIVYWLFREFLRNYAAGIKVIRHVDFLLFEREWMNQMDKRETTELNDRSINKSLLWKYHTLIVNAGYLTMHLITLNNKSSQVGNLTVGSQKGMFYDLNNLDHATENYNLESKYIYQTEIDPSEISGGIHAHDTHTASDTASDPSHNDAENDLPLRLSVPNLGKMLGVLRHARKWVLDTIISGGMKTGMGSTGKSGTVGITRRFNKATKTASNESSYSKAGLDAASGTSDNLHTTRNLNNAFVNSSEAGFIQKRQLVESTLYEKWKNKKESALYKKFKGIELEAVLLDAYGGGWIEPFETPVGICWRYTGKALNV